MTPCRIAQRHVVRIGNGPDMGAVPSIGGLLAQAQLGDEVGVARPILLLQVIQQRTALVDQHQQAATAVVILVMTLEMLGQVGDRSEANTSELQSLMRNSYAVFCLKKKKVRTQSTHAH